MSGSATAYSLQPAPARAVTARPTRFGAWPALTAARSHAVTTCGASTPPRRRVGCPAALCGGGGGCVPLTAKQTHQQTPQQLTAVSSHTWRPLRTLACACRAATRTKSRTWSSSAPLDCSAYLSWPPPQSLGNASNPPQPASRRCEHSSDMPLHLLQGGGIVLHGVLSRNVQHTGPHSSRGWD